MEYLIETWLLTDMRVADYMTALGEPEGYRRHAAVILYEFKMTDPATDELPKVQFQLRRG